MSPKSAFAWLAPFAVARLALHLAAANGYGYFRDELYYLDASRHLAWGYVDYPPFVAAVAAAVRVILGTSPLALRLLPAIAGALMVLLVGLMTRELGGGRIAQMLAALACLLSPVMLAIAGFLSMNPFDQLWWTLLAFLTLRLLRSGNSRLWLPWGAVTGIGLLTKTSMLAWSGALVAGLLITPARVHLRRREFWIGAGLAALLWAPHLVWQAANGWPTLEFWRNYRAELLPQSAGIFIVQQVLSMNPLTLPLTLAGLYYFFVSPSGRPYRAFGLAFVLVLAFCLLTEAKAYFLSPAYPVIFAGGATALEHLFERPGLRFAAPVYAALLLAVGLFLLPISTPVLPINTMITAYAPAMAHPAIQVENGGRELLPEWLAGRIGWPEMAGAVAGVYDRMSGEAQQKACVLAGTYGEAGALSLFGAAYGLPPVISGHNNYYLWGPGECTGEVVIAVGLERERLEGVFEGVEEAGRITCDACLADEADVRIYLCSRSRLPLPQVWPTFRSFRM